MQGSSTIALQGLMATVDFYRTLSLAELNQPNINAIVTGTFSPFLNLVVNAQLGNGELLKAVEDIKSFFNSYGFPWSWWVTALSTPGDLERFLIQQRFELLEEVPSMICDLQTYTPIPEIPELTFEEITGNGSLKEWDDVLQEGFPIDDPTDKTFQHLNEKLLRQHPEKLRQFQARYQGVVVSAGTLFLSDRCVMIHNLATKNAYLKRGFGSALTQHLLLQAKNLGFKQCFLDSSNSAANLYQRLGFEIYGMGRYYVPT